MSAELEKAHAEVERITRLRNRTEWGSPEHLKLTSQLLKATGHLKRIQRGAPRPYGNPPGMYVDGY